MHTAPFILTTAAALVVRALNCTMTVSIRARPRCLIHFGVTAIIAAVAVGVPACGGERGPTQPAVAARLAFSTQPGTAQGAQPITPAVRVAIQDAAGNTVSTATDGVTLTIGTNPDGAALSGTTTEYPAGGIATFANLRIDRPGSAYTLIATAGKLTGATSSTFAIRLTFATVAAGFGHTCGVTSGGAAYCWGLNDGGGLGDGTTISRMTPVLVAGGFTWATVSVGDFDTCGARIGEGAYCWGGNLYGQLGDGTTLNRPSPALGGLLPSFATVSAGAGHSCGVLPGGAGSCWGDNSEGELGDGTGTQRKSPALVAGGLTFTAVNAGVYHTCGVTTAGAAYCWGLNTLGELGDGTTVERTSPTPVAGGLTFAQLGRVGFYHNCGVTFDGAAYCWGDNTWGQLGDGTTTWEPSPVLVAGGLTFAAVSAGSYHTCGVTSGGAAYCWGGNSAGELGDGTFTQRTSPVAVAGGLMFATVSAGDSHTCGVTTGGAAYCWGDNPSGQLGNGTTGGGSLTPERVVQ